jgi:hypothetical protein
LILLPCSVEPSGCAPRSVQRNAAGKDLLDPLVECPTTGQSVERVLQPFAPRYTGTGFYSTDHEADEREPIAWMHVDTKTPRRAGAPRERRSHTASVRSVGIERSPALASEPKLGRAVAALEGKRSTSSH